MPVIKSAKKKLRQDKKRQERNKVSKDFLKKVVKEFKKAPSEKGLTAVYQAADKSVKKHLMHKNKAANLKSSLSKLVAGKSTAAPKAEKPAEKETTKTVKKTPANPTTSGQAKKATKTSKK